ncbi:MAG: NuoF family protein [Crocosphaera sp.]
MNIEELIAIQQEIRKKRAQKPKQIRCCTASGCLSCGAENVKKSINEAIKEAHLDEEVEVRGVGCMGICGRSPSIEIDPETTLYHNVSPEHTPAIIASLNQTNTTEKLPEKGDLNHPFFTYQRLIVRENSGKIDPESIDDYIAEGGYQQLHHALLEMTPKDVIQEVITSGLRGRGGGGYPTGVKWSTVSKMPKQQKYVICNADEGDPGAFMDRAILESDPHRILEGMAIAGYAVGANHGYIYIRAEYTLAIQRLEKAIQEAKRYGLMGSQIFDFPFDFKIDIRIGAKAFICGEETALIASLEGKRGTPRPRPPYPAIAGFKGEPTLINNVETYANIVPIIREGGDWYASIGGKNSKGTKVFALAGTVENSGLIEVPMGISLRTIVEEMGGGVGEQGRVKAVQMGGPSGGCIPNHLLDTPVEYDSLRKLGTIMGSGGMIVMDQNTSMVEIARFYMDFCKEESCGKCIPCRAGTVQLSDLLTKFINHQANEQDLDKLEVLSQMIKETSLCGLGVTAPNPVLSTLHYFREEYLSLVQSTSGQKNEC